MKRAYWNLAAGMLAIAGIAPAAQAVEWQIDEDTTFGVYGSIELIYLNEHQDIDPGAAVEVKGIRQLQDRDTTLGFEGTRKISENLTAFFRAEFEYAGDETKGNVDGGDGGIAETDEIFVGVRGPWGRAQVGSWDGVYEDLITDTVDVFEYNGLTEFEGFRTGEVGDAIAYWSPSFGGFSFAVQGFFKGRGEGKDFDDDPEPDSGQAFQVVLGYTAEHFAVHAGYDDNGLEPDAEGTFGLSASADFAPFTISTKYELIGEDPSANRGSISAYAVSGAYDYGAGSVILAVQQVEPDKGDSRTEIGLNINYTIADGFYVYAEHLGYGRDTDLGNYTGIGAVYEF